MTNTYAVIDHKKERVLITDKILFTDNGLTLKMDGGVSKSNTIKGEKVVKQNAVEYLCSKNIVPEKIENETLFEYFSFPYQSTVDAIENDSNRLGMDFKLKISHLNQYKKTWGNMFKIFNKEIEYTTGVVIVDELDHVFKLSGEKFQINIPEHYLIQTKLN